VRDPVTRGNSPPERLDVPAEGPYSKEEWEHYQRYAWAASRVNGDVLDIACGTGHGAKLLAARAAVTGLDRDVTAVEAARHRTNGRFIVADAPPIPERDDAFDNVVCFETIEHLDRDKEFIREIRRILRPGGRLFISSPNQEVSAPAGVPENPWHVREYSLAALVALLYAAGGFQVRGIYAQSLPPRRNFTHRWAARLYKRLPLRFPFRRPLASAYYGRIEVRAYDPRSSTPGYWIIEAY
jgi:SAM-dependent methyltransferase